MPTHQNNSGKHGFPLRYFAAAFGISTFAAVFNGVQLWHRHNLTDEISNKHIAIKEGAARIMLLDEALTMSARMVLFINHEDSPEDILKWADTAMYQAKEAGRNLIRFYEPKV